MTENKRISVGTDDTALFSALTQRPEMAWPTVFLLVGAYIIFGV